LTNAVSAGKRQALRTTIASSSNVRRYGDPEQSAWLEVPDAALITGARIQISDRRQQDYL
jgi:hypothetical protein